MKYFVLSNSVNAQANAKRTLRNVEIIMSIEFIHRATESRDLIAWQRLHVRHTGLEMIRKAQACRFPFKLQRGWVKGVVLLCAAPVFLFVYFCTNCGSNKVQCVWCVPEFCNSLAPPKKKRRSVCSWRYWRVSPRICIPLT